MLRPRRGHVSLGDDSRRHFWSVSLAPSVGTRVFRLDEWASRWLATEERQARSHRPGRLARLVILYNGREREILFEFTSQYLLYITKLLLYLSRLHTVKKLCVR